ncbi:MAG: hypothetical protein GWP08_01815 [Nitrospiraceae bacterium]|nr:hypothetical protein [Nitrospiraceae bacterium]
MSETREIHVISNTHWDREWLYDFRETRMQLVSFFDQLLDILDTEPEYKSYVLDSQAIPVEDYLEVRPEKRSTIERHVAGGRLLVGPWYSCPEGFCVNGESLVRNLLYGHRVARSFGGVMKVGHTPFSYGQNSQMPQIYMGFGIDAMLFYHGVAHDDTANEFIFEGADGTRILGSQMSSGARYNFYHNVYRRVLYNEKILDREYDWRRGGLPFHLCSEARAMGHHFLLDPVVGFHSEHLEECVRALRDAELDVATTRFLAFMDGHDSSVADTAVLRIIEEAGKDLGQDRIFHSSLPALMDKIKGAVKDLEVLKGERRVPKPMGGRIHLYSDVLSCRTRMKRANVLTEVALQRLAEPFATIASGLGAEYPATLLDTAWKLLLRSHAHDSIAGTGVDDIERDMFHRLRQVTNISKGIVRRGLEQIQVRIDNSDANPEDVLLTVFNPSPYSRTEVVTAVIDLPEGTGYETFALAETGNREPLPLQIVSRKPCHSVVNHEGNATAMMTCERVVLRFLANDVPGFGYATYHLVRDDATTYGSLVCGANAMENEHLRVAIQSDGTLSVTHKETGVTYDGLHYFEDSGEAGNAWMHVEPGFDRVVSSLGAPVSVSLEGDGPLQATYAIRYIMSVPAGLDENGGDAWQRLDGFDNAAKRTEETRDLVIASRVTLRKGARAVEVVTRFDNPAKNHRLRVLFPSRLDTNVCHAESAFDVVEREIVPGPESAWRDTVSPTFPMQRFVDLSDGNAGLAIINDGIREYEVTRNADRAIALTLMRAFEISLTTVSFRWEPHPEMIGSQSLGEHEFRYLIYPHAGTWDQAGVPREAEALALPLEPAQAAAHDGDLPKRHSFLTIEPAPLQLSALKRLDGADAMVMRVFNPTNAAVQGTLAFDQRPASARLLTLEELPIENASCRDNTVHIDVGPKKIVTVEVLL